MHIASFAGIAPVNNPVIAVAVVIDNPTKGASYYGTAVSAPVFAEVAQQVLEYLGVPHDTELHPVHPGAKPAPAPAEDDTHEQGEDINALYAAANDLPADDPLRGGQTKDLRGGSTQSQSASAAQTGSATHANVDHSAAPTKMPNDTTAATQAAGSHSASSAPSASHQVTTAVPITEAKRLQVPSLIGLPVRKVVEQAAAAGFDVKISGSGTAREQAPAAGAMVLPGTKIVVKCAR